VPATISFRFAGDAERVRVLWTQLGASTWRISGAPCRTLVSSSTTHFSDGFAGAPLSETDAGEDPIDANMDVGDPADGGDPIDTGPEDGGLPDGGLER